MIIAVMSPDRKQGVTTISMLLASAIAATQGLSTCLTYTGESDQSYNAFLGLPEETDITKSISQIAKLIENNALRPDQISNYLIQIDNDFYLMKTSDKGIRPSERDKLVMTIVEQLAQDVIIVDVGTELTDDITQYILGKADIVLCVTDQNIRAVDKIFGWYDNESISPIAPNQDSTLYICNKFDSNISSLRTHAANLGVKAIKTAKVTYNPVIMKKANEGCLQYLIFDILDEYEDVIELNADVRNLIDIVLSNLGYPMKWGE